MQNLLASWQEFVRDKKRRKDVAGFLTHFSDNLFVLHRSLQDKTYRHGGYQAFSVRDPKPREIHKASVQDRLVHHALYRVLYPHFDRYFIYDSYSCRFRKGTHRAVSRFRLFAWHVSKNNTRTCWILKCDIRKFFANIDHGILRAILAKYIKCPDTLGLVGEVVGSFHTSGKLGVGLPLGNLTSQLLVNVYMNEFDQFVKRELLQKYYIRYADDFVIMSNSKDTLSELLPRIATFLRDELRLSLHPDKVSVNTLSSGVDFLGWVNFPHHRVLRTSTKKRMFQKMALVVGDDPERVNATRQSYLGLLSHGNTEKLRRILFLG
ncbi:MAG: reverse transcriptase/maturase family protein [bacterium]